MGATLSLAAIWTSAATALPADTLPDLLRTFALCSRVPAPSRDWTGAEITVRFSLRRDGQLIGPPRIAYSRLPLVPAEQKPFVAAALAALATCFPAELTPGLGGAIAGRMLTVRIRVDPRAVRASAARASGTHFPGRRRLLSAPAHSCGSEQTMATHQAMRTARR
jgi:hypothetical protein